MTVRATPASRGGFAYTLSIDGAPIGWIRTGAMGFGPFPSLAAARTAAEHALPALLRWYAIRWRSAPLTWTGDVEPRLAIRHGSAVLGCILLPADVGSRDIDRCAVELRIPDVLWVATAEDLARRLADAVRRAPVWADERLAMVTDAHVSVGHPERIPSRSPSPPCAEGR